MRKSVLSAAALVAALTWPADCQHKVSSKNIYERVWAVVPIVGAGTQADPKRPLYAPLPGAAQTDSRTAGPRKGIIAFSSVLSDDRKFALVEFVAVDRAALAPILTDSRQDVKRFEKGKVKEADVEKEFKKYKKDFDLSKFGAGLQ